MRTLIAAFFTLILFDPSLLFAQDLSPTEDEALMKVKVVDTKEAPKEGQKVTFIGQNSGKEFTKTTGENGSFGILLPKGDAYQATYEVFGEKQKYKVFEVPDKRGKMKFNFKIVYQMPQKVTLNDVHFNTGEATLRESSYEALGLLKRTLERNPGMRVRIAGHTDSRGDKASNQKLSEERAEAVVDYLVEEGIDRSRLEAKGYGERKPIASNDTKKGRQQNRRTEVRILEK
jgi:outer membrane protein OmpA-like peptidoglycan-associated protein